MVSLNKLKVFIAAIILLCGCGNATKHVKQLPNYDLEKPEKFLMPETLLEISGIVFKNGLSDTVYAIQDEEGKLFRLGWGVKKQVHTKFAKKGDYEDVSILNNQAIILKSNGSLFTFPIADAVYEEIDSAQEWKHLLPDGEYEGMYGNAATNELFVVCKNCAADNNKDHVSGYILKVTDSIKNVGEFDLDVAQIKPFTGKVKGGFRPSAMAKNPVTNEWFILSAVNKLLVIADETWKIKEAYPLNGNLFSQAEGIAFDKQGNLYISNEGDDLKDGNILKFVRSVK